MSCRKSENKGEKICTNCQREIWSVKILHTCFSMQYMFIYSSNLKTTVPVICVRHCIWTLDCKLLIQKYEIHFKMLQSKSWGLPNIHVTHFLVYTCIYIYDCLDLWQIILIIEQLWVKYPIRKQIETVSDSNKGVIVDRKFIKFQYWLAIYI